jgi:hypothetical protein
MYFLKKYRRGIKNRYTKKTSIPEIISKDFIYLFQELKNWIVNKNRPVTILAYPHLPSRKSSLHKLCLHSNWNITNKPSRNYDVAMHWEYATFREEYQLLEQINQHTRVINLYCRDISKKTVDEIFTKAFGYSTFVDPLTYQGPCVKKSDINALHDGEIIQCPVKEKDERFIYQKVIKSVTEDGNYFDIRIPIINGEFPIVFYQHHPKEDRFGNSFKAIMKKQEEVLSPEESAGIRRMAELLKIEFGEMDAIRDQNDGMLYVIDVNNTPTSRYRHFSKNDYKPFLEKQRQLFVKAFLT